MLKWLLLILTVDGHEHDVKVLGTFPSREDCIEVGDAVHLLNEEAYEDRYGIIEIETRCVEVYQ